jgi:integrase
MTPNKYKLVRPARGKYWLIRLQHKCADGWQEKSTKETRRRDAERVAAQIMAGISSLAQQRLTWAALRKRYEDDHLPTLKRPGCFKSAANKMQAMVKPVYADDLDAAYFKKWRQRMIAADMPASTISSYMKHVRACLGWAEENGYIKAAPRVRTGSTAKMKGRAITLEEFERMLAAAPKVKTIGRERAAQWKRLLHGLWLMGLRLQEAIDMTWDADGTIRPIRLDSSRPLLVFPSTEHKNQKDQLVPLTPEAVAFLRKTTARQRSGRVFPLQGRKKPIYSADRASRVVSSIGNKARVVTSLDPQTGAKRHATAHDLRRSFAKRLVDRRLPSEILQAMMRHADIKTTRTHYAEAEAEQVADIVWQTLQ